MFSRELGKNYLQVSYTDVCIPWTLKAVETCKRNLFWNDCLAGNIVLQTNKLRYKDVKGDPKGFVTFLDENNLPRGIIPRYRGNRLNILIHKFMSPSTLSSVVFYWVVLCPLPAYKNVVTNM